MYPNSRVRLLLAVSDVTFARAEARQKDDLIREKAILLQEVQHRIANSLQIIASVLMQSARKVQSEEVSDTLRTRIIGSCRLPPCSATLLWLASMTWRSDPISSNFAKASPHQ
jgi:hypothetical protein